MNRMRRCLRHGAGTLLLAALAGCALPGKPSSSFVNSRVENAYIPLYGLDLHLHRIQQAAAVMIAPNLAVTNLHNYLLIPKEKIVVRSRDFDLLFFRTDRALAPEFARPHVGQRVIAYGQHGPFGLTERREAEGVIREIDAQLPPECTECGPQVVIGYDADAGTGFSGGPVVDAASGALVGVTVAFEKGKGKDGGTRMYAYDVDLVLAEMQRLLDAAAR
jgi:hypothetical protein